MSTLNGTSKAGVPTINCRNIWKVFGAAPEEFERANGAQMDEDTLTARGWTAAVRDASFDIARGEVFVIMGLSGSGKSTFLKLIAGIIYAKHTGNIKIFGRTCSCPYRDTDIKRKSDSDY